MTIGTGVIGDPVGDLNTADFRQACQSAALLGASEVTFLKGTFAWSTPFDLSTSIRALRASPGTVLRPESDVPLAGTDVLGFRVPATPDPRSFVLSGFAWDLSTLTSAVRGEYSVARYEANDVTVERDDGLAPVAPEAPWASLASRSFLSLSLHAFGVGKGEVANSLYARPLNGARIRDSYARGEPEPQMTNDSTLIPFDFRRVANVDVEGVHFGDFYEPYGYSTGAYTLLQNPSDGVVLTVRSVGGVAPDIGPQTATFAFRDAAPADDPGALSFFVEIGVDAAQTFLRFVTKLATAKAAGLNAGTTGAGDIDAAARKVRLFSIDSATSEKIWAPVTPVFLEAGGGNSAASIAISGPGGVLGGESECQGKRYRYRSAIRIEDGYSATIRSNKFGPAAYADAVVDVVTTVEHGAASLQVNPWAEGPHFSIDGNIGHTIQYRGALFRIRTDGFGVIGLGNSFGQLGIVDAGAIAPIVDVDLGTSPTNPYRPCSVSIAGDYHWSSESGPVGELLSMCQPVVRVNACFGNCTIGPLRIQHVQPVNPTYRFQVQSVAAIQSKPANGTVLTVNDGVSAPKKFEFTSGAPAAGNVKVDTAGIVGTPAEQATEAAKRFQRAMQEDASLRACAEVLGPIVLAVRGKAGGGAEPDLLTKSGGDSATSIVLEQSKAAGPGVADVEPQGARYPIVIRNPGWVTISDVSAAPFTASAYVNGVWTELVECFVKSLLHPSTFGVAPKLAYVELTDPQIRTHRVHFLGISLHGLFAGLVDVGGTMEIEDVFVRDCLINGKEVATPW
ncbi:MAG TPA: hypothetical protein VKE69_05915 [Planctomycetota bacterium]|nr:hypothetical protein [Planctomycetota bacterium]